MLTGLLDFGVNHPGSGVPEEGVAKDQVRIGVAQGYDAVEAEDGACVAQQVTPPYNSLFGGLEEQRVCFVQQAQGCIPRLKKR